MSRTGDDRPGEEGRDREPPESLGIDDADLREPTEEATRTRLSRLARLVRGSKELAGDTRELLGAVLETSDRAKTEMVRMVAREVRNYLDELRLKEDLLELARSHSLEVKMSISLKPLADAAERKQEG